MSQALVIIPTYNESENISSLILKIFKENLEIHILVVDDNSPDKTYDIVNKLIPSFRDKLFLELRSYKGGLGEAYKHGFKWALNNNYEYIFQMDADFSHNPMELPIMIDYLKNSFDVVIGSRYIEGINVVNWPLNRILLSVFAAYYVRLITRMPIKDPTAGFVGYRKKVLKSIKTDRIKSIGYAFQIEMKYISWKKKFKFKEHPIVFTNREKGISKMGSRIIFEACLAVPLLIFRRF
tara:strand:+ start:369 stop:1079 length:711 start_codon:yes stop_codon:yes gene_type:complete